MIAPGVAPRQHHQRRFSDFSGAACAFAFAFVSAACVSAACVSAACVSAACASAACATPTALMPPPPASAPPTAGRVSWDMVALAGFVLFAAALSAIVLVFGGPVGWAILLALTAWALKFDTAPTDGRGRPVAAFRRSCWWNGFRAYFPLSVHQEQPFDPRERYLFAVHPHGIIGISAWLTFAVDAARLSRNNGDLDVALATVSSNFMLPFWRDLLLAAGFLDASFRSLAAALGRQRSVAVVVGGAAEALLAHPGTNDLILDRRTGFLRLALTTGTPLVPVFVFGENDLYFQAPNPAGSRLRAAQEAFLSAFKVSPPLVAGEGVLGLPVGPLPRARPVLVVTGTPLAVPRVSQPSAEDVGGLQRRYRAALERLYVDHRARYYERVLPAHLRPETPPALRVVA